MKFKYIKMKNYRQYKDEYLSFEGENLHTFRAIMGTGKSNLLNAINWCLYGDEPFLLKKNDKPDPRINKKIRDSSNNNETDSVKVELCIEYNNKNYTYIREEEHVFLNKKGKIISKPNSASNFELIKTDDENNTKFIQGEEVEEYVERFIPEDLRNYFFFDGENLRKYFEKNSTDEIESSIEDISMVNLLDRITRRFENLNTDLHKETSKYDVDLKDINEEIRKTEKLIKELKEKIEELKNEISKGNQRLNEIYDEFSHDKATKDIQNEIDELKENKQDYIDKKNEIILKKARKLTEKGPYIFLNELLENLRLYIKKKKSEEEIPITTDQYLLRSILKENECICGRVVKQDSQEYENIKNIVRKINYSNENIKNIISLDETVNRLINNLPKSKKDIDNINNTIEEYDSQIIDLESTIAELENEMKNSKDKKIKKLMNEKEDLEEIVAKNNVKLESKKQSLKKEENKLIEKKKERDEKRKQRKKLKGLNKKIDFLDIAINKAKKAKINIMSKIRENIIKRTNENFFKLMWKKKTYKKVVITDNFQIDVLDYEGESCINSLSGGENVILALSFTLALQSISGFEAPMVIDRPLARVSGPSRKEVARALKNLAKKRQIFLLLTPHDISDIQDILSGDQGKIWDMNLGSEEKVINIQGGL